MLKLDPDEADDYPEQEDLLVARTCNVGLWRAAHANRFFSGRFSRADEVFCYLKIDGRDGLDGAEFEDMSSIEEVIDEVLRPEHLGCCIGGGTGLMYSHGDMALVHPERALSRIVERLQRGRIPRRSWIQFFDGDLCGEWIGVYPDSPAPPGF